jgi:hypothetical protein
MTGGHAPVDREHERAEMALKLRSQDINLFPLPGHLVKVGVRRDVVGDELQLGTRENSKGVASI